MASKISSPAKASLRMKIKRILQNMSPENRTTQSQQIAQKVMAMPEFKHSKRISIYLSTKMEVATDVILNEMFRLNKMVFVPTYKGNRMEMVRLRDMQDYEELPLSNWNIKQPSIDDKRDNALETGLDLILMPGVAFSKSGGRMGHGMGFYDTYIKRLSQLSVPLTGNKTILIGLAFKEQILSEDELPMEEHDCFLDAVITSE